MACFTIICNIIYKSNSLIMVKSEVIFLLVVPISKKKCQYKDVFNKKDLDFIKKDLVNINKVGKMPNKSEDIKMPKIKQILFQNKHTVFN